MKGGKGFQEKFRKLTSGGVRLFGTGDYPSFKNKLSVCSSLEYYYTHNRFHA